MGHQVGKKERSRRGSLQFYPRVRAKRIYPRIRNWNVKVDGVKLLGFPAYKVGMAQAIIIDNKPKSPTVGEEIVIPVTFLEAPPIKVFGLRLYKKDENKGLQCVFEYWKERDKFLERKIKGKKSKLDNRKLEEGEKLVNEGKVDEVRVLVQTQPHLAKIKKKPEVMEIKVNGNVKEAFAYAKSILGKELRVKDVLSDGNLVDSFGITKGKGYEGPVKRFGIKVLPRKTKGVKRKPGTLGAEGFHKVIYTVPLGGQHGFHQRCDYNKWIIKIIDKDKAINPSSGWHKYGLIDNDTIVIKGSIQGTPKRLAFLRFAIRPNKKIPKIAPELKGFIINRKEVMIK